MRTHVRVGFLLSAHRLTLHPKGQTYIYYIGFRPSYLILSYFTLLFCLSACHIFRPAIHASTSVPFHISSYVRVWTV